MVVSVRICCGSVFSQNAQHFLRLENHVSLPYPKPAMFVHGFHPLIEKLLLAPVLLVSYPLPCPENYGCSDTTRCSRQHRRAPLPCSPKPVIVMIESKNR